MKFAAASSVDGFLKDVDAISVKRIALTDLQLTFPAPALRDTHRLVQILSVFHMAYKEPIEEIFNKALASKAIPIVNERLYQVH